MGFVHRLIVLMLLAVATPAAAAPVHGLVYEDRNGDGRPSVGEPGVANAVVALGIRQFATTDAQGAFVLDMPANARGCITTSVTARSRMPPCWPERPCRQAGKPKRAWASTPVTPTTTATRTCS